VREKTEATVSHAKQCITSAEPGEKKVTAGVRCSIENKDLGKEMQFQHNVKKVQPCQLLSFPSQEMLPPLITRHEFKLGYNAGFCAIANQFKITLKS